MAQKRIVAVTLASILVAGALSSCEQSTDMKKNAETAIQPDSKKNTIKIFTTRIQPNSDSESMKQINEKIGYTLEVKAVPDADYEEKLNLYYSSNEMPDVFSPSSNTTLITELLKNGTAKFTEDDLKTYMPLSYAAAIKQYQDYGISKENAFARFTVDGKLAGFYIGQTVTTYPYGLLIRKDKLDEFGLNMPRTISDWEELFKVYKQKYPNKYPITAREKDTPRQSFNTFLAAYGVIYDHWMLRNNKLVYAPFMPEMREALTTLSKWYKAGYINPEWVTMDTSALNNEWINGNTLYYQFAPLNISIQAPFSPGSIFERLTTKNPQAKLDWIAIPTVKEGIKPALINYEGILNQPLSFGKHLEKDPDKLHAIMSAIDKLKNDKDLIMLQSFGILGKTYDMVNGIPMYKKEFSNADAQVKEGIAWGILGGNNWETQKSYTDPQFISNLKKYAEDASGLYSKANNEWAYNRVNGPLLSPSGENLDAKGKTKYEEWNQIFAEVIIGSKTLDDFDKFIEKYKKEVGNDMTEAANRLYLKQWQ